MLERPQTIPPRMFDVAIPGSSVRPQSTTVTMRWIRIREPVSERSTTLAVTAPNAAARATPRATPLGGGRSQGLAFEFDEVGDMNRVVYALMAVVAAPVASDLHYAIENPNRLLRRDQGERLADQGMRD